MHKICVRECGDVVELFRLSFLYFWFLMSYLRMTTVFVPVVVSLCVPPQAIYLNVVTTVGYECQVTTARLNAIIAPDDTQLVVR